jgi:hypothetical protein
METPAGEIRPLENKGLDGRKFGIVGCEYLGSTLDPNLFQLFFASRVRIPG